MKNGLFSENGELVFYKDDKPCHAGAVKIDGDIYYIGKGGRAVKGTHVVHREMGNDILQRGTYVFGEDYKLVKGSYIAPKKQKKRKNKSKKTLAERLKNSKIKQKTLVAWLVVAIAVFLTAAVFGLVFYNGNSTDTPSEESAPEPEIVMPTFENEVLLCSEAAKQLYDGEISITKAVNKGAPYRAFVFEYSLGTESGTLALSENPDLSNAKEFVLSASEKSISIDNLKTGTKYYYKALVGGEAFYGSFTTAKSTRFIKMDGVYNTRDIGGYTAQGGKTVKQGMIIRGTELDGLVEPEYYLNRDSVEYVKREFGFVCDLDLRDSGVFIGNFKTRLGDDVSHKFYASPMYGSIFDKSYKQAVKDIFSDLANPDNYPMYMHCTYGADRTGTIVFLLQGLLGVEEEALINEYRLTGFHNATYATSEKLNAIISGLEAYQGDTLQERITDYLVNGVGVTEKEIQSIKSILLE